MRKLSKNGYEGDESGEMHSGSLKVRLYGLRLVIRNAENVKQRF
jgi:hypothetical protein